MVRARDPHDLRAETTRTRRSASTWSIVTSGGRSVALRRPGRAQAVPGLLGGVAVAAVEQVAQLGVVERGVEVAGQDPQRPGPARQRAQVGRQTVVVAEVVGACTWTARISTGAAPGGRATAAAMAKRVSGERGSASSGTREYRPVPVKPGRGRSTCCGSTSAIPALS